MIVPDDGPKTARLVICGEAPGRWEMIEKRPFVGPSGRLLNEWLAQAGLHRSDCYVTNVLGEQPNAANDLGRVPQGEVEDAVRALHERLAALRDPWLVVPTGATALWALTGRTSPPWQKRVKGRVPPGIVAHRGSIYGYRRNDHTVKVIPTIHPAATFRQPRWAYRCKRDWQRIAEDATFRELRLPDREHLIRPTLAEVWEYVALAAERCADDRDMILAIDVETLRKTKVVEVHGKVKKSGDPGKSRWKKVRGAPRVSCVGFSYEPHCSMTIPTEWGSDEETQDAWAAVRALCALDCDKVMQNGLFDAWWLAQRLCPVQRYVWDPRWMSHCVDPLDDHDLGYLASLDTREPYWKADAKGFEDPDGDDAYDTLDTFYRYNGKDAAVTRELADVWKTRIGERYWTHYAALYEPLLRMMLRGMRLDSERVKATRTRLAAQAAMIRERLREVAGANLFGPKDLSSKRLAAYLYETLGLPKQYHTVKPANRGGDKRRALTANEVTVRKLALRYPAVLGDLREADEDLDGIVGVAPLILAHRRLAAQAKFVKESVASADGRVRTQYGWVQTRRLASGKAPDRSGQNLQNVDRALREAYMPEDGALLVEVDLSQAEHRYVLMLMAQFATGTRREELLWRARARSDENDEHARTAQAIFRCATPTKAQRELGKRTNHAGNYGERGRTMSESLLKDGIVISEDECQGMLDARAAAEPEIELWHRDVRRRAMRDRKLVTPFGLVWDLTNERLNDDLFRSCYAMEPQNAPPEIVNLWGLGPLDAAIERGEWPGATILLQTHDAITVSVPPAIAHDLATWLVETLEQPITIGGEALVIPATVKVGRAWGTMTEFKALPTWEVWDAAVAAL